MRKFVIEPEDVARKLVDAMEKDKREITVPWFPYRFVSILQALLPATFGRFVGGSGYKDDARF